MKNLIRSLILAPAVVCATAAFAADTSTLNVPFSFTAHGKSYPAGQYSVSVDANHQLATLTSRSEISKAVGGTLRASDGNPSAPAVARLEFTSNGESHQLRRIRYGALSTTDMAAPSRHERVEEVGGSGAGGK